MAEQGPVPKWMAYWFTVVLLARFRSYAKLYKKLMYFTLKITPGGRESLHALFTENSKVWRGSVTCSWLQEAKVQS